MKNLIKWRQIIPSNAAGKAVILENDEWRDEKEWDEVFGLMQNEQKNP